MGFDQRLCFGLDHIAVVVEIHPAAHALGASLVDGRLGQVHALHTTLAGIARIGTTRGQRGTVLVFDRNLVEIDTGTATGNKSEDSQGKGNTLEHEKLLKAKKKRIHWNW